MGRGIPWALRSKYLLEANLADKGAAIGVHLNENDAAEAVEGFADLHHAKLQGAAADFLDE